MLITGADSHPGTNGAVADVLEFTAVGGGGSSVCTIDETDLDETERLVMAARGSAGPGPRRRPRYRPGQLPRRHGGIRSLPQQEHPGRAEAA